MQDDLPDQPLPVCMRCAYQFDASELSAGWCPRCGDMGSPIMQENLR